MLILSSAHLRNKLSKERLFDIVDAHAGQVAWPESFGTYDRKAGKPTLDILRRVLRGNYGYSPDKIEVSVFARCSTRDRFHTDTIQRTERSPEDA